MPQSALPSISIVTPSYNQARFLPDTIQSVLGQQYPCLEYSIVDGGSSDTSVDVIRSHEAELSYWVSEPDGGMYEAVQKGFDRSTGEIMGWINSDDVHMPWTLKTVGSIFAQLPEVRWLTTLYPLGMNECGIVVNARYGGGFDRRSFFAGANLPNGRRYFRGWIMQEGTFWRRSLWEKAGGKLDTTLKLAGDFELWSRFFQHADLYGVGVPLAAFRYHAEQKTATQLAEYLIEGEAVLSRYGRRRLGLAQSISRRILYRSVAGRPLRKLPAGLGAVLSGLGILRPFPAIGWENGRWTICRDYAV